MPCFGDRLEDRKKVVIVGGGFGGVDLARRLDKKCDVTLIDKRSHLVHKIGSLRAAVDDEWVDKVLVPRDGLLKNGRIVNQAVTELDENRVVLQSGGSIEFDYLVCATGSQCSGAEPNFSASSRTEMEKDFFRPMHDAIQKAKNIFIIGGGVVGLELAGEIRSKYRKSAKKVTIIHSGDTFVNNAKPTLPRRFQWMMKLQLMVQGIDYVLGEIVDIDFEEFGDRSFLENRSSLKTKSGRVFEDCDLIIKAVGIKLNNGIYPESWLDQDTGAINVSPTLQVSAVPKGNVFAIGDIANLPESKMVYLTLKHSKVAAINILRLSRSRTPTQQYKPATQPIMIVPIGRAGITVYYPFVFGPIITYFLKARTLMLDLSWSKINKRPPKGTSKHNLEALKSHIEDPADSESATG